MAFEKSDSVTLLYDLSLKQTLSPFLIPRSRNGFISTEFGNPEDEGDGELGEDVDVFGSEDKSGEPSTDEELPPPPHP